MPTTSTALITTGIAGKKLVEKTVTDLYDLAKAEVGFQLKKRKAINYVDNIYRRIRQLRLVKTIWQLEKEIDLSGFYYPSKIQIENKRVALNQIADFGYDGNILIEGTVGQGKSILLRYLASVDFCLNRRVPIFLELRRVRQGQTLLSLVLGELNALGFEMSEQLFRFFADKGRLVLFLDAFDEVKEEVRQTLLTEIEDMTRQHEQLRVIATSRPDI